MGLLVVAWTLVLGPVVAGPVMRRLPAGWFRVPAGERVLHHMLGVGIFRWLLERSGWERHVHKREFHATRAGLPSLEVALRSNASAHGTCFAVHVLFAAFALVTGHPMGAVWILLPRRRSSVPGAAPALHHASTPAAVSKQQRGFARDATHVADNVRNGERTARPLRLISVFGRLLGP